MVLAGVLKIEDFYSAIEWKVVFLIAGLIPLGIAMQKTGTAAFLAKNDYSSTGKSFAFNPFFYCCSIHFVFFVYVQCGFNNCSGPHNH